MLQSVHDCKKFYWGTKWVARAYCLHCCKAACQSNHLFYLEEDVTLAVANAAWLGVGLGAVCADVVESLNAILKRAYNDHTARRGGECRGLALEREGEVVLQAWEWWFLKFDLPLQHRILSPMTHRMEPSPPPPNKRQARPPKPTPGHKGHPRPQDNPPPPQRGGDGADDSLVGTKVHVRTPRAWRWAPSPVSTGGKRGLSG